MKRMGSAAALVVALSACTSVPVNTNSGDRVPASRIALPEYTTPTPGARMIIITRDSYVMGGPVDTRFYINRRRVANIGNGEVLRVYLKDGRYRIGVKINGFDDTPSPIQELDVMVKDGEDTSYRVYFNGSSFAITPSGS